jgi:Alcohol dehydrogenase GroES-like domain
MKAGRIHYFGPPNAVVIDEIPCPTPKEGELVVRVAAAGVGPWDALLREGKSVVQPSLPIILGSDLAGVVECVGPGVIEFKPGDELSGVTNKQFCGAYAEYAVASAQMVAAKPASLRWAACFRSKKLGGRTKCLQVRRTREGRSCLRRTTFTDTALSRKRRGRRAIDSHGGHVGIN